MSVDAILTVDMRGEDAERGRPRGPDSLSTHETISWPWPGTTVVVDNLGVVDWSRVEIGDSALDLAILTRGASQPFGSHSGLRQVLECHSKAGGPHVTERDVYAHEVTESR